jgi:hypothetical protein
MSALVSQILIVAVLFVSTVLVASRVWCDETSIGSELGIKRFNEIEGKESRSREYLRLDLSRDQENSLLEWSLHPQRSNREWWGLYRTGAADSSRVEYEKWMKSLPLPGEFHSAMRPGNKTS